MNWVYQKQADGTFTVGFYTQGGSQWVGVSNQATEAEAQALVSYLNGGTAPS